MSTDSFKSIKLTQPTPGGPLVEQVVGALAISTTPGGTTADSGKIVVLNASGQIDSSLVSGGSSSSSVFVNGVAIPNPNFEDGDILWHAKTATITSIALTANVVTIQAVNTFAAGDQVFVSGNTNATFLNNQILTVISTGLTGAQFEANFTHANYGPTADTGTANFVKATVHALATTGASVVTSTSAPPTHQGQLLISQPGNTSAAWADPFVQGPWVNGTPIVTPGAMGDGTSNIQPVFVAGYDGTNMRGLLTSTTGQLHVITDSGSTTIVTGTVAATQSGTWTVQQGSPPWVVTGNKTENVSTPDATFVATLPALANTASPSWTDGKLVPLSVDTTGSLRTTATFTGTLSNNITQWASTVLGAPSAFGTSPGAVNVIGTNSVVYAIKSGSPAALITDGAGNLDVNTQAAVFAAANGTAVPTSAVWLGASDGTNLQGLLTESVGNKNLRVVIFQGGNVASVTGANRLAVDIGTTGTVAVSGTVLVSNTTQNYTQGSTTSGQIGPLVQAAVTTSNPSYTTAQTSPLSLDTSGHLRTFDKADGLTGSPVPTTAIFIGGVGADSNLHGLSTDNAGKLNVNASFSGSVSTALPPDNSTTGTITNTQNVVLIFNSTTLGSTAQGGGAATFNITGSWTGTIVFEASTDGTNFYSVNAIPYPASGATVSQSTGNGQWLIATGGLNSLRLRGNTVTSGTATVWIEVGIGSNGIFVLSPSASDFFATVTQGNAGTIAQSWFTKITDGANVFGTTSSFPLTVTGTLTNNNAAPTSNNVGVLPARATGAAPTYTDGDQVLLSVDTTGALRVSSSGTFTPALTADITATGTIANPANPTGTVTLVTQGTGTTQFNITGSWTGTILFEASVDGVNFVAAKCLPRYPTTFPEASQTTANGQWAIATGGLAKFRLRGASVATGTATVWIEGGAGAQDIQTLAMVFDPASGNVPAVKGSTTVPVAADNALVVALSPNSAQFATSTTANSLPGVNPIVVGASSVAVVNSNAARKEVTIVNTGTTVIFLGFGQTPTTTAYHVALAKCTLANDGTGGTWTSDMWKGSVNAIGSAGGGAVVLTELT